MTNRIIRSAILAGTLAFALTGLAAADDTSVVSMQNNSAWNINELYLSAVDVQEWGDDQLGEHVIANGETFKLSGVPCDVYDVRLVDEDGDVCIVGGVKLCGSDSAWTVSDDDLLACQSETEE